MLFFKKDNFLLCNAVCYDYLVSWILIKDDINDLTLLRSWFICMTVASRDTSAVATMMNDLTWASMQKYANTTRFSIPPRRFVVIIQCKPVLDGCARAICSVSRKKSFKKFAPFFRSTDPRFEFLTVLCEPTALLLYKHSCFCLLMICLSSEMLNLKCFPPMRRIYLFSVWSYATVKHSSVVT